MNYVGIDISKDELVVCLLGAQRQQHVFANTRQGASQLVGWLKKHGGAEVLVGMEATGSYGELVCDYLYERGLTVTVINPARIKAYAASQLKRHKTDAIDAALIADFCRTQATTPWSPPPAEARELRSLVRHWEDLKQQRQAERNRLEAKPAADLVVRHLTSHITFLDQQIQELTDLIRQHIQRHPHLKAQVDLLTSIPGIGDTTATHLIAELGDLTRFDDVRQVVALVGLNPRQRQSGSSLHYTAGISRMGKRSLRAALYMPALVAKKHNPVLKAFAERLVQRQLKPQQITVAVMRKLLHLAYGVLKNKRPFDPTFAPACS